MAAAEMDQTTKALLDKATLTIGITSRCALLRQALDHEVGVDLERSTLNGRISLSNRLTNQESRIIAARSLSETANLVRHSSPTDNTSSVPTDDIGEESEALPTISEILPTRRSVGQALVQQVVEAHRTPSRTRRTSTSSLVEISLEQVYVEAVTPRDSPIGTGSTQSSRGSLQSCSARRRPRKLELRSAQEAGSPRKKPRKIEVRTVR